MNQMVKLAAFWADRQGLNGSLKGAAPAEVLTRAGWSRGVGGANPYVTLFARAGTSQAETEAAIAAQDIHELPSARNCTYILPKSDYALGLRMAGLMGQQELRTAERLFNYTMEDAERLNQLVKEALKDGPLDPRELKTKLGEAVVNFGPEGKAKGLTTSLPISLGILQVRGEIRRIPADGRLDKQDYKYALWDPSPLKGDTMSDDEVRQKIAEYYFQWIGPASMKHFQWFTTFSQTAAKAATAHLDLVPIEGDLLMPKSTAPKFESFQVPTDPQISFIASLDSLLLLRREIVPLLSPEHQQLQTFADGGVREMGHLMDLYCNAIVDRGRIVGLWEYDPEKGKLIWFTFDDLGSDAKNAAEKTESLIQDLGDCRSFSLDSPKSRRPKLDWLTDQMVK